MALLLVSLGVAARLWFREIPNFAPISAIALFAGFYWSGKSRALLVPIIALLVSDFFLSGYEPLLRVIVYSSLAAPVFLHSWIQDGMRGATHGQVGTRIRSIGRLFIYGVSCSLLFYVTTNLATWGFTAWYSKDVTGLAQCMLAGLPFLRYTLAGDLTFGVLLFGGYALAANIATEMSRHTHPAIKTETIVGANG